MYTLTSKKAIDFYEKNSQYDFNKVNELLVDIIGYVSDSTSSSISESVLRNMLDSISSKIDHFDLVNSSWRDSVGKDLESLRVSYGFINTLIEKNKDLYLSEMKNLFERKDEESLDKIKEGIAAANNSLFSKTMSEIPKGNEVLIRELDAHKKVFELETHKMCDIIRESNDFDKISQELDMRYEKMQVRMSDMMQGLLSSTSHNLMEKVVEQGCNILEVRGMFSEYVEKQKNSTLKGKESEIKLEMLLNDMYPYGKISNNTGEAQSCDYLLERDGKESILFENKDYKTNVPDVEIKKLVRDIENKKMHGILLSQRSGVQNKKDFQIDIHMGLVIIYVHNVNYDGAKIRIAVQMIDHLVPQLKKLNETQESSISLDLMADINKEYLCFIGQKKQMIENLKRFHKEMTKQIDDIEMPKLTGLLNSKFTNVEQLEFKCNICNNYTGKSHRALVTHQNTCRKRQTSTNEVIELNTSAII